MAPGPCAFPHKMAEADGIKGKDLLQLKVAFSADPKNLLAQNVCTQHDPVEMCLDRKVADKVSHVFKHKVRFRLGSKLSATASV